MWSPPEGLCVNLKPNRFYGIERKRIKGLCSAKSFLFSYIWHYSIKPHIINLTINNHHFVKPTKCSLLTQRTHSPCLTFYLHFFFSVCFACYVAKAFTVFTNINKVFLHKNMLCLWRFLSERWQQFIWALTNLKVNIVSKRMQFKNCILFSFFTTSPFLPEDFLVSTHAVVFLWKRLTLSKLYWICKISRL